MKTVLLSITFFMISFCATAQITTPVTRANFGVDADLRSNFTNGLVQSGTDDWFLMPGTGGSGQFIIDTTGAAAIVAGYTTDLASRRLPFYKTMRFPGYSVINNRMLLDAVFIRDYHGDDSTVFSGGNKNGDNPSVWQCPISQGVPDKNDILDMMVHIRRAGPNKTDSLWMFGGLSLDNIQGQRYFDFEMYQTDIYYNRGTLKFYGYGPEDGHTAWQFDATGDITKPGDIIFSAEFQSSSLTNVEARIWVHKDALLMTPKDFDWGGQFDGTGTTYGYASIKPKNGGTYYTGLQCANNTWAGPFSAVMQDNSVVTTYIAKQYVEFSVNLTKLGLDPVTLLGSDVCGMPFRRVLVKTRTANTFTSELKDFVGPFDLFLAPRVEALSQTPYICESMGMAELSVTNPVATSFYQWQTLDGNIVSGSTGPVIYADKPGTYVVTQYLQQGCGEYATDTVQLLPFAFCGVLKANKVIEFHGSITDNKTMLSWKSQDPSQVQYFEVQRSIGGGKFLTIGRVEKNSLGSYSFQDNGVSSSGNVYYRIKLVNVTNIVNFSDEIVFSPSKTAQEKFILYPNPVKDVLQIQVTAPGRGKMKVELYDAAGRRFASADYMVQRGQNLVNMDNLAGKASGVCLAVIQLGNETYKQNIILTR
jgi:hypothetical protein